MEVEAGRDAIWEVDTATGAHRTFASGLRKPVGMGWEPNSGALWAVVNERDELDNDLVPDYLTSVSEAAFYGWPSYSYFGPHVDHRVKPQRPDLVASAISPDYALGSHIAPQHLMTFIEIARPTHIERMLVLPAQGGFYNFQWTVEPTPMHRFRASPQWELAPDARLRDVIVAVRADEERHRDVNHALANQLAQPAPPYA